MKKYLVITLLSMSLFWGMMARAAESPFSSTKVIEALVNTFSFNTDGTFDVSNVNDLTLTGDLTVPGSILANTGTLTLGGTGGTNNENLTFDFETTSNEVAIASTTGVATIFFKTGAIVLLDDVSVDEVIRLTQSGDDGILQIKQNNVTTINLSGNANSFIDTSSNFGIGTQSFPASMMDGLAFGNAGAAASAALTNGWAIWAEDTTTTSLSSLAIRTETGTSTVGGSTIDTKVLIRWNGGEYYLHLDLI